MEVALGPALGREAPCLGADPSKALPHSFQYVGARRQRAKEDVHAKAAAAASQKLCGRGRPARITYAGLGCRLRRHFSQALPARSLAAGAAALQCPQPAPRPEHPLHGLPDGRARNGLCNRRRRRQRAGGGRRRRRVALDGCHGVLALPWQVPGQQRRGLGRAAARAPTRAVLHLAHVCTRAGEHASVVWTSDFCNSVKQAALGTKGRQPRCMQAGWKLSRVQGRRAQAHCCR